MEPFSWLMNSYIILRNSSWKNKFISLNVWLISSFLIVDAVFSLRNLSIIVLFNDFDTLYLMILYFPEFINSDKNCSLRLLISFNFRVDIEDKLKFAILLWRFYSLWSFYFEKLMIYSWEIAFILLKSYSFNFNIGLLFSYQYWLGNSGSISSVFGFICFTYGVMGSDS